MKINKKKVVELSRDWFKAYHCPDQFWNDFAEKIDEIYSAGEEVSDEEESEEEGRIATAILDAINSGLWKWEYKKKLSPDDAFDLLTCLQDQILKVKLTRPAISEEEIDQLTEEVICGLKAGDRVLPEFYFRLGIEAIKELTKIKQDENNKI
jgi:hypothetical protein